jgi:hypothetical protein
MFEKDANLHASIMAWDEDVDTWETIAERSFQKGAEFGYNKANEWHYVKDGDLPSDEKNYQNYVVAYYGAKGSYANGKPCWEELCYDTENKRWVDKETLDDLPYVNQEGIVIAWKEIVLPELKESKKKMKRFLFYCKKCGFEYSGASEEPCSCSLCGTMNECSEVEEE